MWLWVLKHFMYQIWCSKGLVGCGGKHSAKLQFWTCQSTCKILNNPCIWILPNSCVKLLSTTDAYNEFWIGVVVLVGSCGQFCFCPKMTMKWSIIVYGLKTRIKIVLKIFCAPWSLYQNWKVMFPWYIMMCIQTHFSCPKWNKATECTEECRMILPLNLSFHCCGRVDLTSEWIHEWVVTLNTTSSFTLVIPLRVY